MDIAIVIVTIIVVGAIIIFFVALVLMLCFEKFCGIFYTDFSIGCF